MTLAISRRASKVCNNRRRANYIGKQNPWEDEIDDQQYSAGPQTSKQAECIVHAA